jgi:hypothetical protein
VSSDWAINSKSTKTVQMNYANFNSKIILPYRCTIVGWTGKFVNPSEIGSIEELRTLYDAWASGAARWIRLTAAQVKKHKTDIEEQIERGEMVVKVRKRRSDAGQSRGGKRKASEKENIWPRKAKQAQVQLPPKSKEFIEDEDAEDEDMNEEEDEYATEEFQQGSSSRA